MRTSGVSPVPRCQTSAVQLEGDLLLVFGGACHAPVITERQQQRRDRRRRRAREDRGQHGSDSSDEYEGEEDEAEAEALQEEEWLEPSDDSSSDEEQVVYGDRVVDLGDIQLLDLQTETWLKCASSYPPLRGGSTPCSSLGRRFISRAGCTRTGTQVTCKLRMTVQYCLAVCFESLLAGCSDAGARMPSWTGELAEMEAVLPAVAEWQAGSGEVSPLWSPDPAAAGAVEEPPVDGDDI